jgi:UrcA family protein
MKNPFQKLVRSTSLAAIGAYALICGAPPAAMAQDASVALTNIVSYADLNLESGADAKVLYARLRLAATKVCRPFRSIALADDGWQACFDSALAKAVTKINNAKLTKLYQQSNPPG